MNPDAARAHHIQIRYHPPCARARAEPCAHQSPPAPPNLSSRSLRACRVCVSNLGQFATLWPSPPQNTQPFVPVSSSCSSSVKEGEWKSGEGGREGKRDEGGGKERVGRGREGGRRGNERHTRTMNEETSNTTSEQEEKERREKRESSHQL